MQSNVWGSVSEQGAPNLISMMSIKMNIGIPHPTSWNFDGVFLKINWFLKFIFCWFLFLLESIILCLFIPCYLVLYSHYRMYFDIHPIFTFSIGRSWGDFAKLGRCPLMNWLISLSSNILSPMMHCLHNLLVVGEQSPCSPLTHAKKFTSYFSCSKKFYLTL